MRASLTTRLLLGLDVDFVETVADLGQVLINDDLAEYNVGNMPVGSGETKLIPLGDIALATLLYLRTTEELDLIFNGGTDILKLKPLAVTGTNAVAQEAILVLTGEFSAIQVTNPSGTKNAAVIYALAGTA